jgi:hypothetical protein
MAGPAAPDGPLDAGDFGDWLADMGRALHGERDAPVPCGGCTACCRSSQFVAIGPDETDTLAHVPPRLLFPAPGRPAGHVLLGYDERGRCPLLTDDGCSIYEHRPRTCRTYDCRVFAAAGVDVDDGDARTTPIGLQARRWRFTYAGADDRRAHAAVRDTARSLRARAPSATQLAVRAVAQTLEGTAGSADSTGTAGSAGTGRAAGS